MSEEDLWDCYPDEDKNHSRAYDGVKRNLAALKRCTIELTEAEKGLCHKERKPYYLLRRCPSGKHTYFIDPRRRSRPKGLECTVCYRAFNCDGRMVLKERILGDEFYHKWRPYFDEPE